MRRILASVGLAIALLAWSAVSSGGTVCQNGSAPTETSAQSAGPFTVGTYVIPNPDGYRAGTVYYPASTISGTCVTFGGIVLMPGYRGDQSILSWLGTQLASNGFIVLDVDTYTPKDSPDQRATEVLAALRQLVNLSDTPGNPISGKVDNKRLGVVGHSAGGGGVLLAARDSIVKAAIAMAPWHATDLNFSNVVAPTLVMTCQNDQVVPSSAYSLPMYDSIAREKAYVELTTTGAHFCVASGNGNKSVQSRLVTSWMKRWLDGDTRYTQFLCGTTASASNGLQAWRDTCPY